MATLNLKSLISKLDGVCRKALEAAAGLCLSRTQYNIEIEHWLLKLLEVADTDLLAILNHYEIDIARLQEDLTKALDRLRSGNAKTPAISPDVIDWVQAAWLQASLEYHAHEVRTGHLVLALLSNETLARIADDLSNQFDKISVEDLRTQLPHLMANSGEVSGVALSAANQTSGVPASASGSKQDALNQFTVDLTAQAKAGKIDPVLGRDAEIRQIIDILTRRRQNNPILTGEAGVGKTAVVEGFALRIAKGDVPPALKNVSIRVLDLALLQAGAGIKGEFENRLKSVIAEVKQSPQPIILFIDEAHTLIGAGGAEGQGDAANLLKPALARGELRTIAATTWAEYKKYFEKDPALTRRFQVVKIEEPTEQQAIQMMRGVAAHLEKHHAVRILDEAIEAAVKLSKRYIPGRQLPDKCVSLLDTACAKVAMSHSATPASIEDCQRRLEHIEVEQGILNRENLTGAAHDERLSNLSEEQQKAAEHLAELTTRWEQEKGLATEMRALREKLEDVNLTDNTEREAAQTKLQTLTTELKILQGEDALLQVCVDAQAVAEIIASWTGIPVGRMMSDEINAVLAIQHKLAERVIGQDHALAAIARTIQVSRANLSDPRKPIGVFLLAGTSGTGKTETALALADLLYGGEQNVTVINMSEFKEAHKVSMLVGSPPGYVGYGEGGVLTNAVRRRPYSVILLDEMEKAHPSVQEIFYQVFDKGMIMDGEGREIDFKNTVIIMTTNAGTQSIMKAYGTPDKKLPETAEELAAEIRPELLRTFKPAFLGRTQVVPFIPLDAEVIKMIVKLQLAKVAQRIKAQYKADFTYTEAVLETITNRCQEVETGARNVEHLINGNLLPALSTEFLTRMANGQTISKAEVDIGADGEFVYSVS
ncbi:MAG: type VI secretion system ATPase TssH [Gammaproteobacteria bacterium]|nr:type VI secretion system ATPase TssH [Gammaproteobacteria bacterium]